MQQTRAYGIGIIMSLVLWLILPPIAGGQEGKTRTVVDFTNEADVETGDVFQEWMEKQGWSNPLGGPKYFFVRNGRLHLVSKPGPVFEDRYVMAVFNRDKLINQIENKVLIGVTPPDFRVDPDNWPLLNFVMTPIQLPPKEADLRDSDKNDSAFYLLVSFDTEKHDYRGYEMPRSISYVWANQKWPEPVASDPDYEDFMRYIPIGYGDQALGAPQTITRQVSADYRAAYPEAETVPDIIEIGLMIDSNTVGGTAESALSRIRFEKK